MHEHEIVNYVVMLDASGGHIHTLVDEAIVSGEDPTGTDNQVYTYPYDCDWNMCP